MQQAATAAHDEIQALKAAIAEKEGQLLASSCSSRKEIHALTSKSDDERARHAKEASELSQALRRAQDVIERLTADVTLVERRLGEGQTALEAVRTERDGIRRELEDSKQQLELQTELMSETMQHHISKIEEMAAVADTRQEDLLHPVSDLQALVAARGAEVAELTLATALHEGDLSSQIAVFEAALADKATRLRDLEERLELSEEEGRRRKHQLQAMDADGTTAGFDLPMLRAVRAAVTVPVIASGGAGAVGDFAPAVQAGADAVLAASVFHFGELTIGEVKKAMAAEGITVR